MKHNFSVVGPDDSAPPVWPSYALAQEILERLAGFPKYPQKGHAIYVEALMKCVSAEHARAAIDVFDEEFPTLRRLREMIFSTKAKFVPEVNLREQWEREGATYDPDFLPRAVHEAVAAKEAKEAKERERLLKLRPLDPMDSESARRVQEALEAIDPTPDEIG